MSENTMSENISALIDEELEGAEHARAVEQLCQDPALKERWERYHVIRSALRGECTPMYLRSVYERTDEAPRVAPSAATLSGRRQSQNRTAESWFRSLWPNWMSGYGLAASLTAAVFVGFLSGSIIDLRFGEPVQSTGVATVISQSVPVQWLADTDAASSSTQSVDFLNQALLAHGESSSFALLNGLSNYAKLVVYER